MAVSCLRTEILSLKSSDNRYVTETLSLMAESLKLKGERDSINSELVELRSSANGQVASYVAERAHLQRLLLSSDLPWKIKSVNSWTWAPPLLRQGARASGPQTEYALCYAFSFSISYSLFLSFPLLYFLNMLACFKPLLTL